MRGGEKGRSSVGVAGSTVTRVRTEAVFSWDLSETAGKEEERKRKEKGVSRWVVI